MTIDLSDNMISIKAISRHDRSEENQQQVNKDSVLTEQSVGKLFEGLKLFETQMIIMKNERKLTPRKIVACYSY